MAFKAIGIVQNEIYQKLMFDKLEIMRTYVNTFLTFLQRYSLIRIYNL